jgi:hypothetical protein
MLSPLSTSKTATTHLVLVSDEPDEAKAQTVSFAKKTFDCDFPLDAPSFHP